MALLEFLITAAGTLLVPAYLLPVHRRVDFGAEIGVHDPAQVGVDHLGKVLPHGPVNYLSLLAAHVAIEQYFRRACPVEQELSDGGVQQLLGDRQRPLAVLDFSIHPLRVVVRGEHAEDEEPGELGIDGTLILV